MECVFTLVAFGVAWLVTQVWKLISGLVSGTKNNGVVNLETAIGYFMRSGGMPSGHTASLTAAILYIGFASGFGSSIFALGVCVWMIVVYDAIHVRYAVGEQGKALNQLLEEQNRPKLPLVEGHTVPQVVVGAILGVVIGAALAWVTGLL